MSSGKIINQPMDPHFLTLFPCLLNRLRPRKALHLLFHVLSYEGRERFGRRERIELKISSELGERFEPAQERGVWWWRSWVFGCLKAMLGTTAFGVSNDDY
jgi:hypothetical protein